MFRPQSFSPSVTSMPASAELLSRAERELQEKPEWRERDIQALRDMVLGERDLNCRMDDGFLLMFLRARKFDYDRAFQLLKNFYKIRSQNACLYANFRPSALKSTFDLNLQTMLPERDQFGRRVFIFKAGNWNPEQCSLEDIYRTNEMCMEFVIEEEETQINGIVAIADLKDFSILQAKYFSIAYMKLVISLLQDCFPGRFKAFHFVNENAIFDFLFVLVKPFLSEKLRNRIRCHGHDMKTLHQCVRADILPRELGGPQPPMDNSEFVRAMLEKDDEFYANTKYGYGDTNHDQKTIESYEGGLVGNYYRKLCVE